MAAPEYRAEAIHKGESGIFCTRSVAFSHWAVNILNLHIFSDKYKTDFTKSLTNF